MFVLQSLFAAFTIGTNKCHIYIKQLSQTWPVCVILSACAFSS